MRLAPDQVIDEYAVGSGLPPIFYLVSGKRYVLHYGIADAPPAAR